MIHYDSIHDVCITVPASDEDLLGKPCSFSREGTLYIAQEGIKFVGVCKQVRNGFATLQIGGVVTMKYSGTVPNCGFCNLCGAMYGAVMADSMGREYMVLSVDEANKTVTFVL